MSEASKKRLPLHKHLSYQIVEASKEEFSPRERGVHATDVLLDSTVSLAETLTSFTRLWEAEVAEEIASWAETVDDAAASNEKAVKDLITNTSIGDILKSVKSTNLNLAGNLYYVVRLKVSDNTPTSDIAKIQVYDEAGATALAEWVIAPNDFPNPNEYHHFACLFELPKDKTQITLKVILITAGLADLWVDYGGLIPKTMPIAYADVTVLTRDPGTDAGVTNPGTDAGVTDPGTDAAGNTTGLTVDIEDPLSAADLKDPASAADTRDPLTDAIVADGANKYQVGSKVLSNQTIGTSKTILASIPPDNNPNAIELGLVGVIFAEPDGSAQLYIQVEHSLDGTHWYDLFCVSHYISTSFSKIKMTFPTDLKIPWYYIRLSAKATVTRVFGDVRLIVWGFEKHDHSITGDSHDHSVSGDSHDHTVSGDSHDHGTTEPTGGHDHTISGDSHDHDITGDSHDHTISGDSHDHLDETLGHQH